MSTVMSEHTNRVKIAFLDASGNGWQDELYQRRFQEAIVLEKIGTRMEVQMVDAPHQVYHLEYRGESGYYREPFLGKVMVRIV